MRAGLIIDTVRRDGSVLIPVDTAARVLELLLWLNEVCLCARMSTCVSGPLSGPNLLCLAQILSSHLSLLPSVLRSLGTLNPHAALFCFRIPYRPICGCPRPFAVYSRHETHVQVWNSENLHAYHLVWINQFADTIHTYAKSTLEWMSTEMMNAAINSRGNPFDIMYVLGFYAPPFLYHAAMC